MFAYVLDKISHAHVFVEVTEAAEGKPQSTRNGMDCGVVSAPPT